jgi:hypothetical protein
MWVQDPTLYNVASGKCFHQSGQISTDSQESLRCGGCVVAFVGRSRGGGGQDQGSTTLLIWGRESLQSPKTGMQSRNERGRQGAAVSPL